MFNQIIKIKKKNETNKIIYHGFSYRNGKLELYFRNIGK